MGEGQWGSACLSTSARTRSRRAPRRTRRGRRSCASRRTGRRPRSRSPRSTCWRRPTGEKPAPVLNTQRIVGDSVGATGVVGLAVGTGFGVDALDKNSASKSQCLPNEPKCASRPAPLSCAAQAGRGTYDGDVRRRRRGGRRGLDGVLDRAPGGGRENRHAAPTGGRADAWAERRGSRSAGRGSDACRAWGRGRRRGRPGARRLQSDHRVRDARHRRRCRRRARTGSRTSSETGVDCGGGTARRAPTASTA